MNIRTVFLPILSVILTASLLCGCSGEPSDSNSGTSSVTEPTDSFDRTPSVPDATFLKGALGDPIGLSEITKAFNAEFLEVSPDQLTEDDFGEAEADCAYFAYPSYSCLTSLDNSYDADNVMFTGVTQKKISGDYFKVKTGDIICGLTVGYASSSFNPMSPVKGSITGTFIGLEGEKTVTGYAWIEQQDEYGITAGDIKFIPSGDVNLPVVRFDSAEGNGIPKRIGGNIGMAHGIYFTNDFGGSFDLGNISDTAADISALPTDGSYAKVNITLTNIRMYTNLDWLTYVNADIVSVELA